MGVKTKLAVKDQTSDRKQEEALSSDQQKLNPHLEKKESSKTRARRPDGRVV